MLMRQNSISAHLTAAEGDISGIKNDIILINAKLDAIINYHGITVKSPSTYA